MKVGEYLFMEFLMFLWYTNLVFVRILYTGTLRRSWLVTHFMEVCEPTLTLSASGKGVGGLCRGLSSPLAAQ